MKIAITGKGGTGKSTITALMARVIRDKKDSVLLVDADPDMNLAAILGIPEDRKITPIIELKELISERTGVPSGQGAPLFKMNPRVEDIPDKYCVSSNGIKLIVMGTTIKGGGGCSCPENAFLKSLLSHMMLSRKEWVIMDMEAGIEHLGRGTAIGVDHMMVVVEPNKTSIATAHRINKLSEDLHIKNVHVIANKIYNQAQKEFVKQQVEKMNIIGFIEYSDIIAGISLGNILPMDINTDDDSLEQIRKIINSISDDYHETH
ncbi:MAG: ArsA-related P-loop ATPase [Spirochaetota bacterium]